MEGLGIFGDLPQLDQLPAVGSNHDDRVNINPALFQRAQSRAGVGQRFQGKIPCHYAMHGHPLQKDSYRLLDFTVAVGTSTHL